MRNTKQKSLILEIVSQSFSHPTAYMIYQDCIRTLPNISLGTVYRNLNTLVELGKIKRLEVPGHIDRYDKINAHDHFICFSCGNIIDLERRNFMNEEMIDGNRVIDCKIRYEGICRDCLEVVKKGDE